MIHGRKRKKNLKTIRSRNMYGLFSLHCLDSVLVYRLASNRGKLDIL